MKADCCANPEWFLPLKEFRYWTLYLHANQSCLGRVAVFLRRHLEDLFEIKEEEWKELFEIVKKYKNVAGKLFKPDLFNYSSLGNTNRHAHFHIIPRYRGKRVFLAQEFTDKRWGLNYSSPEEFRLESKVWQEMGEKIKKELEK